ncbi:MAG: AI-2E family transporter [Planctomycetota bacterium]
MVEERTETEEDVRTEILSHRLEWWRTVTWSVRFLKKAAIWSLFFLILYLLRDFFPLVFLTFVFSFVTNTAARAIGQVFPKVPWKGRVVGVFLFFLVAAGIIVNLLVPQVVRGFEEVRSGIDRINEVPALWDEKVDPWLYDNVAPYRRLVTVEIPVEESEATPPDGEAKDPETGAPTEPVGKKTRRERLRIGETQAWKDLVKWVEREGARKIPQVLADVAAIGSAIASVYFLSLLFSFLVVFDIEALRREIRKLESTRLDNAYTEVARDLVKFGSVLGKVLEAQAVIALVNTILTAIGLWALGLPNVWLLSLVVFFCGFIPVAGVFISSVPICLTGLWVDGPGMMMILVVFITLIHFLEAYVLNPRIMGAALRVNPVLVLVILVIGHHALGVWGLLLGLPICYYFFTHVIKKEDREIGLRVKFRRRGNLLPEGGSAEGSDEETEG